MAPTGVGVGAHEALGVGAKVVHHAQAARGEDHVPRAAVPHARPRVLAVVAVGPEQLEVGLGGRVREHGGAI